MGKGIRIFILIFTYLPTFGQHLASTIQDAEKRGISINLLDSIYISAVHADTSKAVFKTDSAQQELIKAYTAFLQELGKFLTTHNFRWEHPVRAWNRVYFNSDGTIDYFLYTFHQAKVPPERRLTPEKKHAFNRLLNLFIQAYHFPLKAGVKFAQCSPVTYMPPAKN